MLVFDFIVHGRAHGHNDAGFARETIGDTHVEYSFWIELVKEPGKMEGSQVIMRS